LGFGVQGLGTWCNASYGEHGVVGVVGGGGGIKTETTSYEPLALHAPIQWAIYEHVIKSRQRSNILAAHTRALLLVGSANTRRARI
jgi:hypothetical protein